MQVVICGGGIAGLTLAWWLNRAGWEVTILEQAPGPRDAGYMIDFFGPGWEVASRMGLVPSLEQARYVIPRIMYVNGDGRRTSSINYERFRHLLAGRLVNLMRGELERILLDHLPESVAITYGATVRAFTATPARVEVSISDGRAMAADLLVGADGIHSRVRKLAFGAESRYLRPLGYDTAAYLFRNDALRDRLAGNFVNLSVPDRTAGLYPIREGRIASFFVHAADGPPPGEPCARLREVYGDLGWLVPAALERCLVDEVYYDTVAQVEMPRWTRGRVTLVGDACGAVSLLAGQGASLAMAGAWALALELTAHDGIDAALARYEARLRPVVERAQKSGRKNARWVVPSSRMRILARDAVLKLSGLPGLAGLLKPIVSGGEEDLFSDSDGPCSLLLPTARLTLPTPPASPPSH